MNQEDLNHSSSNLENQSSKEEAVLYESQSLQPSQRTKIKKWCYFLLFAAMIIYICILQTEVSELTKKLEETLKQKKSDEKQFANVVSYLKIKASSLKNNQEKGQSVSSPPVIPAILWLYTDFRFESEKMYEQLQGNYLIKIANQSGFQIRFVNKWSAYQWISKETQQKITKAMQNTPLEVHVRELLRMALLMEHGGVVVRLDQILLTTSQFSSFFKQLKLPKEKESKPKVLLFSKKISQTSQPEYYDFFVGAEKGTQLIVDTFDILIQIIRTGELYFSRVKKEKYIEDQVGSPRVNDLTRNIIQSLIEVRSREEYSVSAIETNNFLFTQTGCQSQLVFWLKQTSEEYNKQCGQPNYLIHISDHHRTLFEDQLENQILTSRLDALEGGYWYNWMTIPKNRRVFQPSPLRKVSYCLLDAHPGSDLSLIKNSFERLKKQTFKNWAAIYFIEKEDPEATAYAEQQIKSGYSLKLVIGTGSVGRNYEVGIIHHCPNKSFVVILRREEKIEGDKSLQRLESAIVPRGVLGALVGVSVSGQVTFSSSSFEWYKKITHNGQNPAYEVMNDILNHLRVFHSDCYKIIPQFELRSPEGKYYNDRFNFLEHFVFMVRQGKEKHEFWQSEHNQRVKWFIKSNEDLFDVPDRIIRSSELVISSRRLEEVDQAQIHRNYFKEESTSMVINADHFVKDGIPMEDLAVFNPGNEFQPYTVRDKPQLIPKKMHMIWIDGNLPPVKQTILDMNKKLYPDYEWRIWTIKDVTPENFPYTHDLLLNIYKMENISKFSKRATMADAMRQELIYHHGGFYMDSSMFLFSNVFNQWLSYKIALSTERTFRHRWSQSFCMFGIMPKFPPLLRIISHNNTNQYNLWQRDAQQIAGPSNFRWLVRGMEEYDPDYLIMGYDAFYPLAYGLDNHYETYCFCLPKFHSQDDQVIFRYNQWEMIANCSKYYPYAYSRQTFLLGGSWVFPKW